MSVFSEAVQKKNERRLKNNKQNGQGPLAPGANQSKGSQTGMGQGNQQDQMAGKGMKNKYGNKKGAIHAKGIAQMKADGMSDKKIDKKLANFQERGGKLGERAAERVRGDMKKGSTIDDFDAGRVLTKRDVKYMQAQGFADDKIQSYVANNKGKVGKGAANWLTRQQAKPAGGTGDSGSDGGAGEATPTPANQIKINNVKQILATLPLKIQVISIRQLTLKIHRSKKLPRITTSIKRWEIIATL